MQKIFIKNNGLHSAQQISNNNNYLAQQLPFYGIKENGSFPSVLLNDNQPRISSNKGC